MYSIAIDGPSGAGKSTLARKLAQELGYLYVDTGAIYRTVGLKAHRLGIDATDRKSVEASLAAIDIQMVYSDDGSQKMLLDGEDVSEEIRMHAVSQLASQVAAIPAVRAFLLEFQRQQARENHVVMDGRDIGTVVLPDATVKIYLTASPEARADRRQKELIARGQTANFEEVLHDIKQRDHRDMTREIAPLRQGEDAVLVDTTQLNFEESLAALLAVARGVQNG